MTPGKRALKGVLIALGGSFLLSGIIVLFFSRNWLFDLITEQKKSYDALSVDLEDMKPGDHVTVDVVFTAGYAITKSEWLGKGNTVSYASNTRYYLVPVLNEKDDYRFDHYVLVSKTGNYKKIDAAAKAFQAWWNGEGPMPTETVYSVDGRVTRLNKKEKEALEEFFDGEDYDEWVQPYVIRPFWDGMNSGKSGALAMVIASIILIVVNTIVVIIGFRIGHKKKNKAE
ncbi:MAG: hypothetical protein J6S79_00660 [Lachnospiraceae bacterium]|nr:hypothetical protein [Lachnospiraceae bacterium]